MSGLRTILAPLSLWLMSQIAPAFAQSTPDPEWFAICTGRLSALMEMQFLTDGPASEATRDQRDAMAGLLDAVAEPEQARHLMALRVEAKWAYRALLEQAAFGPDPDHKAQRQAKGLAAGCTDLILG